MAAHFAALYLYLHEEMEAGSLSPLLTEAPAREGALRRPQTPEWLPSKRVYVQNQHREPLPDGPHEWEPGRFAHWRDGPICSADHSYIRGEILGQKKKKMKRISKPTPERVLQQSLVWRSEQLRKARSAKASHRTA